MRFLFSANPGSPLLPLQRVASGGELARAMLALRLASYSDSYAASHPTQDRIEETSEKLAEDLYREMIPPSALARSTTACSGGSPRSGACSGVGR